MPRKTPGTSNPDRPKRVTLQDIADVAGVRKMAVSNALNGAPNVSPAMREKIKQIAKDLNYIPNFAAKALNSGRTGIIAVMSGPVYQSYYGNIIHRLEMLVNAEGYHLLLMRQPSLVQDLVNSTGQIAVDGAIAIDMLHLVREFQYHPAIPCVSISTFERSYIDNVIVDLTEGVSQAMDILLKSGRKRIGYMVTVPRMAIDTEVRARVYRQAMAKAGKKIEIVGVFANDFDLVVSNLAAYIEEKGCPDALLCQNDDCAMNAYRVIRDAGYRIPEDVLLVGCDGQWHTRNFDPPISTIATPLDEICNLTWQFLRQRIADPKHPHQRAVVQGRLIERESLRF